MWKAWALTKHSDSITFFPHCAYNHITSLGIYGILLMFLAACSAPTLGVEDQLNIPFYLPPTLAASDSNKTKSDMENGELLCANCITPAAGLSRWNIAEQSHNCFNNLTFIRDISIPDGSQVISGEHLDKRWSIMNNGTCNWDKDYRLKLVAGPALGAPIEQALFPIRSKLDATIRILFIAPDTPGVYRSAWQAFSPKGEMFGDPFFIEIVVGQSSTSP